MNLPFYAAAETLPSCLPTTSQIENSQDVLVHQTSHKVVGVGAHFIVKYGLQIDLEEGQTMIYIRECTTLPAPNIYALFQDSVTGKRYIIMERITGTSLEDIWPSLRHIEKEAISSKVKSYINELRLIPSPTAYCSVGNKPLRDPIFWTGFGVENQGLDGPFDSEPDLNDAIIKKCLSSDHLRGKAEFFKRHLPLVFGSHPPVLTHGDLQRKNILVRIKSDLDIEITFLDWETAGWYPSYWEYARAILACGRFEDDWGCWVDRFLDPFPNEWLWMHTMMLELW